MSLIFQVTFCLNPPSNIAQLLTYPELSSEDLCSIKIFITGGSYAQPQLLKRMKTLILNGVVYNSYGMTETGCITHLTNSDSDVESVGQTADGLTVKIVDENGHKCGIGIEGEICMKTVYPFLGYLGDNEETKNLLDHEFFIQSGDMGKYNEKGDLLITGRKKDILKYKNQQISPYEIEKVILSHSGVKNVCVVGIPDMTCIDLPAAVVVRSDSKHITEMEISAIVSGKYIFKNNL